MIKLILSGERERERGSILRRNASKINQSEIKSLVIAVVNSISFKVIQ